MIIRPGRVYIVGAGPGDPELLTVKAWRLLRAADIVLHDALVGPEVVEGLPRAVAVVDVGKRPGGERTPQEAINRRLVEEARAGHVVVRLKGGDPMVFGRGGEEAEYLAVHGVPFEVVPGVTSVVAAPGGVGIPLTHRDHASSVTVVAGHEDPTKDESALDWGAIAGNVAAGGTLVVLMGVGRLAANVRALTAHGVGTETPAAIIERATRPDQFVLTAPLGSIAESASDAGIEPPAVVVIGDVVGVREAVADWLDTVTAPGVQAPEQTTPAR